MIKKFVNYLKAVMVELKLVKWPSRKDTTNITILVVGFSILIGYLLGAFDFIFIKLISYLI